MKCQAVCHYLFISITLLGCVAPWITPRHFPTHPVTIKMNYHAHTASYESRRDDSECLIAEWMNLKYCKMHFE